MNQSCRTTGSADQMPHLSQEALSEIHKASITILNTTGINFNDETVTARFKQNGFKTDGNIIFFTENQIEAALSTTIPAFDIHARNAQFTVNVGEGFPVLLATGGAPNVAAIDGSQRPATLSDFQTACKLVQTSVGAVETVQIASATIQLAGFYNLPCRIGSFDNLKLTR